jgi:hypothetical protein
MAFEYSIASVIALNLCLGMNNIYSYSDQRQSWTPCLVFLLCRLFHLKSRNWWSHLNQTIANSENGVHLFIALRLTVHRLRCHWSPSKSGSPPTVISEACLVSVEFVNLPVVSGKFDWLSYRCSQFLARWLCFSYCPSSILPLRRWNSVNVLECCPSNTTSCELWCLFYTAS